MTSLETHNYLDAAIGLQFNECSIIAADACRLALERSHEYTHIRHYRQQLILPNSDDPAVPTTEKLCVGRGAVIVAKNGEKVELTIEHTDTTLAPQLIARFVDDIAFPLASFKRNPGSLCDYVQVGSEMTDESLAFHTASPRIAFVGAISMLLQGKLTAEHEATLIELIDHEMKMHAASLPGMYEKSIARRLSAESSKGGDEKRIVLDARHGSVAQKLRFIRNYDAGSYEAPQGVHTVDIVDIGVENDGAYMAAITREAIVVPLLYADRSGKISIINDAGEYIATTDQQLENIRTFLVRLKAAADEKAQAQGQVAALKEAHNDMFDIRLERSRTSNGELAETYDNSLLQQVMANEQLAQVRVDMLDFFGVHSKIERLVGTYSASHQTLATKLLPILIGKVEKMHGSTLLKNRMIGSIATDVYVELEFIAANTGSVEARILGRPNSFDEGVLKTLMQRMIVFDAEDLDETEFLSEIAMLARDTHLAQDGAGTEADSPTVSTKKRRFFTKTK